MKYINIFWTHFLSYQIPPNEDANQPHQSFLDVLTDYFPFTPAVSLSWRHFEMLNKVRRASRSNIGTYVRHCDENLYSHIFAWYIYICCYSTVLHHCDENLYSHIFAWYIVTPRCFTTLTKTYIHIFLHGMLLLRGASPHWRKPIFTYSCIY